MCVCVYVCVCLCVCVGVCVRARARVSARVGGTVGGWGGGVAWVSGCMGCVLSLCTRHLPANGGGTLITANNDNNINNTR